MLQYHCTACDRTYTETATLEPNCPDCGGEPDIEWTVPEPRTVQFDAFNAELPMLLRLQAG